MKSKQHNSTKEIISHRHEGTAAILCRDIQVYTLQCIQIIVTNKAVEIFETFVEHIWVLQQIKTLQFSKWEPNNTFHTETVTWKTKDTNLWME